MLAARGTDTAAEHALAELCQAYWYPLYTYVRRRGYPPTEAEDLTQAFFERLLEKKFLHDLTPGLGRFRSFLLASLKHFLANEWDRAQAFKRGGGKVIISLDGASAEEHTPLELADPTPPDELYDRQWACTLLEHVLAKLRREFATADQADLFDQLKPFLSMGDEAETYAAVAARTGQKEGTIKVAVHRLRRRYGELLRAEITSTLKDPNDVEDEIRHLIAVLGR